jgi:hypothetical protein
MIQFGNLTLHKGTPVHNKKCMVRSKNNMYCLGVYSFSMYNPFQYTPVNRIYLKDCTLYTYKNDVLVENNKTPVTMWNIEDEYWILQESYLSRMKQKLLCKILSALIDETFIVDPYLYRDIA